MKKTDERSELGRIIAQRVLKDRRSERPITILIGAPRKHPEIDWECPFLIEGMGESRVLKPGGVDSLQALLLAIEGVRLTLEQSGRTFEWLDNEGGHHVPLFVPNGYGRRFEERVNLAIEREKDRVWRARLKGREADLAACEAELKERKKAIAELESSLEERKNATAAWRSNLRKRKR